MWGITIYASPLAVDFDIVCAFSLALVPLGHFKFYDLPNTIRLEYGLQRYLRATCNLEGFYDYPATGLVKIYTTECRVPENSKER